jgi:hypothetical protein
MVCKKACTRISRVARLEGGILSNLIMVSLDKNFCIQIVPAYAVERKAWGRGEKGGGVYNNDEIE